MTPHVRLRIEELVLEGFAPGDRYRIGEAVERELARLLSEQGAPGALAAGAEASWLAAPSFELAPESGPDAVGSQVAAAVYGGLGG